MKTYCHQCYYWFFRECRKVKSKHDTPTRKVIVYHEYKELNSQNSCRHYKYTKHQKESHY